MCKWLILFHNQRLVQSWQKRYYILVFHVKSNRVGAYMQLLHSLLYFSSDNESGVK